MSLIKHYLHEYYLPKEPTNIMNFSVTITETNKSTVFFETEEEARDFMKEPDYDLCRWECVYSKSVLSDKIAILDSND